MRAIVQEVYGPPREVLHLAEVPVPVPGPGQVLVRVHATSVHADVWHAVCGLPYVLRLMGSGLRAPKQPIPGTDLAAEVVQVGPGATRFTPGERVFGEVTSPNQWANAGTFAEFAAVDEERLAPIPDGLAFEGAAAVPTAALIALRRPPTPSTTSPPAPRKAASCSPFDDTLHTPTSARHPLTQTDGGQVGDGADDSRTSFIVVTAGVGIGLRWKEQLDVDQFDGGVGASWPRVPVLPPVPPGGFAVIRDLASANLSA